MLDTPRSEVVWRVLATHTIHHFPLHFPSRASPCAITFQLDCSNAGAPCSEVVWRVLATHSIRQFPLHFPFRSSPCAITFQLDSKMTCARKWPLIQNGTKFKNPPSLPDLFGVRWLIMQKDKFNTTGCVVYLYNTQFLTQLSHCLCSDTFLSISLHIVFNLKALVLECLSVLTLSFTQRLRTGGSGVWFPRRIIFLLLRLWTDQILAHPVIWVYSTWSCFNEGRVDEPSVRLIFSSPLKSRNDSITARSCWFFCLSGVQLSFTGVLISP